MAFAEIPPCVHLSRELDLIDCPGCKPGVKLKTFACDKHGKCVIQKEVAGYATCWKCPDLESPDKTVMIRKADEFIAAIPPYDHERFQGRGVILAGGGPRYLPGIYVTVRALRFLGCELPIEVWYLGRENEMPDHWANILAPLGVRLIDADQVRKTFPARMLNGWELKVYACLHSHFAEFIFLDSDCYPVQNPEFLFDLPEYRKLGSIFWCDTPNDHRLKWDHFNASKDPKHGSIESGQFLIDKSKCWRELNLAWHFNDLSQYYYPLCYGDKHTFEASWARFGTDWYQPGPSHGGFRSHAFTHVDHLGRYVFLHRVCDKWKFEGAKYNTKQVGPQNVFHADLDLEEECFMWMNELAVLLPSKRDVLNLCCRDAPMPGAINHDQGQYRKFVEVVHDLRVTPWPWADSEFIRVQLDDGIEHFPDLVGTMNEAHRILKAGGLFKFTFPHCDSENAKIDPTHALRLHPKTFEFFTPHGFGSGKRIECKKWTMLRQTTVEIAGGPNVVCEMSPIK